MGGKERARKARTKRWNWGVAMVRVGRANTALLACSLSLPPSCPAAWASRVALPTPGGWRWHSAPWAECPDVEGSPSFALRWAECPDPGPSALLLPPVPGTWLRGLPRELPVGAECPSGGPSAPKLRVV